MLLGKSDSEIFLLEFYMEIKTDKKLIYLFQTVLCIANFSLRRTKKIEFETFMFKNEFVIFE